MITAFLLAISFMTTAPAGCPAGPIGLVGCCREAPHLLSRYDVPYRAVAKRKRLKGVAIVEVIIEPHGSVCAARILKGLDADFDRAALSAVKAWRFRAAISNRGQAITSVFNLSLKAP